MINSFDPMIHGLKNIYILRQGFKDIFRRHFVLCIHKTEVYTVGTVCVFTYTIAIFRIIENELLLYAKVVCQRRRLLREHANFRLCNRTSSRK